MTDGDDGRFEAAVAAGVLSSEQEFARLLRSIVEVARAIFSAKASSIFLFDEEADELVFAAVAGDGEQSLVGRRMPSSTGIAGWVLSSRTPLVLDDVQNDPRFARNVAEKTGYVPKGMMAVPLLDDERVLGVLQVLDRPERSRFSLQEMELLGMFASQSAIALSLLGSARTARAALAGQGDVAVVARLAAALDRLHGPDGERSGAAVALLENLTDVLSHTRE
ncbi:MAG: GAF domain-containing protein [Gaiellaceae bacterium]